MSRYIEREKLLQTVGKLESLARERVYDTPTNSPAYQRYSTQMIERASFIDVIKEQPIADVVEIVMDILDEAYEILKELKDEYRRNEEIREACAVRCAMIKLAELKDKYTEEKKWNITT